MAEGLPEGLVTTREGVAAVVEGEDRVEAEQVAACWRSRSPCQLLTSQSANSIHCSLLLQQSCSRREHRSETPELLLAHLEQRTVTAASEWYSGQHPIRYHQSRGLHPNHSYFLAKIFEKSECVLPGGSSTDTANDTTRCRKPKTSHTRRWI